MDDPTASEHATPRPGLAQRWCALSLLHGTIESHIERALQARHDLSTREYSVLLVLSTHNGARMRMSELSEAVVLSQSATTRLVNRMEERGLLMRVLCADDRRGIYTAITDDGQRLLAAARPTNDTALAEALDLARHNPELAPLVDVLERHPESA
ncbi:MarR family transcriptional regulator [Nocardiopsis gilva YIM 90087]|uniref:MarR family transcriptional regulator n=1 Tax=Nocardiopsis gilva YIM 90087 TaxID=1235441 RepID=A0A223SCM7_9ACTN|nr:MarR family transcriptional regulator [Nocardiopsis gilva]ASU85833.1 MarR family transcriptional regulator [Nocardiopsis gilva YIM 90087]